jgi:hypothetical protein
VRPTPLRQQSTLHTTAMTDEASSQPNDSSVGEPSPSTTGDAMGDAADAAAAAALIALPHPAAAAAGWSLQVWWSEHS